MRRGDRVLILAHRGELLEQAADKLAKATGLRCATEKAEESCLRSWFRVTVGSVQTLMREKRLGQFPADYFDDIIIDEAHHCLSDSYQRILEHFPYAKVLGASLRRLTGAICGIWGSTSRAWHMSIRCQRRLKRDTCPRLRP